MNLVVRTATGLLGTGLCFILSDVDVDVVGIDYIKRRIESETGIPTKYQKLCFMGKLLDHEMLRKMHENRCIIDLAPNSVEALEAFVASSQATNTTNTEVDPNEEITVELVRLSIPLIREYTVTPSTLVEELKRKHAEWTGHEMDFVFAGTRLRDGYALMDYNIRHGSRLYDMYPHPKGVGCAIACNNRTNRILRPLIEAGENLALNLYPRAIRRLAGKEHDIMFAALQKTLGPVLVANGGRRVGRR